MLVFPLLLGIMDDRTNELMLSSKCDNMRIRMSYESALAESG